jgi:ankyrin repeat protein
VGRLTGNYEVVKVLIETGKVEVDVRDNVHGQTPLDWATKNGHDTIAKLLLELTSNL